MQTSLATSPGGSIQPATTTAMGSPAAQIPSKSPAGKQAAEAPAEAAGAADPKRARSADPDAAQPAADADAEGKRKARLAKLSRWKKDKSAQGTLPKPSGPAAPAAPAPTAATTAAPAVAAAAMQHPGSPSRAALDNMSADAAAHEPEAAMPVVSPWAEAGPQPAAAYDDHAHPAVGTSPTLQPDSVAAQSLSQPGGNPPDPPSRMPEASSINDHSTHHKMSSHPQQLQQRQGMSGDPGVPLERPNASADGTAHIRMPRPAGHEPQAPVLVPTNAPVVPDHLPLDTPANCQADPSLVVAPTIGAHSANGGDSQDEDHAKETLPEREAEGMHLPAGLEKTNGGADGAILLGTPEMEGLVPPSQPQQLPAQLPQAAQTSLLGPPAASRDSHLPQQGPSVTGSTATAEAPAPGQSARHQSTQQIDQSNHAAISGTVNVDSVPEQRPSSLASGEADRPSSKANDPAAAQPAPESKKSTEPAQGASANPGRIVHDEIEQSSTISAGPEESAREKHRSKSAHRQADAAVPRSSAAASSAAAEPRAVSTTSIKVAENETLTLMGTFKPGRRPHGEVATADDGAKDQVTSERNPASRPSARSQPNIYEEEALPGPPAIPPRKSHDDRRMPKDSRPSQHGRSAQEIVSNMEQKGSRSSDVHLSRDRHGRDDRRRDVPSHDRDKSQEHGSDRAIRESMPRQRRHGSSPRDQHRAHEHGPDRDAGGWREGRQGKRHHSDDRQPLPGSPPRQNGHGMRAPSEPHSAKRPRKTPFAEPPQVSEREPFCSSSGDNPLPDRSSRRSSDLRRDSSGAHRHKGDGIVGRSPRKGPVHGTDYYDDPEPGMGGDLYQQKLKKSRKPGGDWHRNGHHQPREQPSGEDRWGMDDGLQAGVQFEKPQSHDTGNQSTLPEAPRSIRVKTSLRELSPGELPSTPSAGECSPEAPKRPSIFKRISRA